MRRAGLVAALIAWLPLPALAVPLPGEGVPAVEVADSAGHTRKLPGGERAQLILYEDQDAGAQNRHVAALLERAARPRNQARLEFLAVGDVARYDFWPARSFVLSDIRKREAREGTTIWLDWRAAVRTRWSLRKGRSAVVLLARDGTVSFAAEGPLSPAQVESLTTRLRDLGCDLDP